MAKIKKKSEEPTIAVAGIKDTMDKAKAAVAQTVEQNKELEMRKQELQAQVQQITDAQAKLKVQFDMQQGYVQALVDVVGEDEEAEEEEETEEGS
jgi:hypothetical protein